MINQFHHKKMKKLCKPFFEKKYLTNPFMEKLLLDILKAPLEATIENLETFLNTEQGQREFFELLQANNIIAFTYMKMQAKAWITKDARTTMLKNNKNFFYNLVYTANEQNFNLICDFMSTLYLYYAAWDDFVMVWSSKGDERSLQILNAAFKKYLTCTRSDQLYSEINTVIETLKPMLTKLCLSGTLCKSQSIVGIFYSLVFQDLHPFFEDSSMKFMEYFSVLFSESELQNDICDIFNLFILKYPECIEINVIAMAVLKNITEYEYNKYQVLLNITRKRDAYSLNTLKDMFVRAIKLGGILSEKEREEITCLPLEYTRNIIKGHDVFRGTVIDILVNCRKMFGDDWVSNLFIENIDSTYKEEMYLFLYTALNYKSQEIIKSARINIRNAQCDVYLALASFKYLIKANEYDMIDPLFIDRNNPCVYISMYYLSKYLDKAYPVCDIFLDKIGFRNKKISQGFNNEIVCKIFEVIENNIEDEFSSLLMHRIVRNLCVFDIRIYEFVMQYIKNNIININCLQAYSYFFDIISLFLVNAGGKGLNSLDRKNICDNINEKRDLIFASLQNGLTNQSVNLRTEQQSHKDVQEDSHLFGKIEQDLLSIVEFITSNEIIETYQVLFYSIAVLVSYSRNNYSYLVNIISQEKLWQTKELLLSMVCLTISLYRRGYLSEPQIEYIYSFLHKTSSHYSSILLFSCVPSSLSLENITCPEERFVCATTLLINNLLLPELYNSEYILTMNYLNENYVTKKNVRRIVRALVVSSVYVAPSAVYQIIERNLCNVESEGVPFSVILTFDV